MGSIAVLLRKPPYGETNAAEAVRHALGAVSGDHSASLVLIDGGVQLGRRCQDDAGTDFTNLGAALKDCCDMGVAVIAEEHSLRAQGLRADDLIEGVVTADEAHIAAIIKNADTTMIY